MLIKNIKSNLYGVELKPCLVISYDPKGMSTGYKVLDKDFFKGHRYWTIVKSRENKPRP